MTSSLDAEKQYKSQNFHKTVPSTKTYSTLEELDVKIRRSNLTLCLILY